MNLDNHFVNHFDQVALRCPQKTAVESHDQSVSYRELVRQSMHIAQMVSCKTSGPNSIVGLHLEKSPELLAAIIGIWRAGCAWVPISPQQKFTQQQFMIQDCCPPLIFTANPDLPLFEKTNALRLPADSSEVEFSDANFYQDDLAYVIYTSGTTGTPRGVEVTHAGVMNLFRAQTAAFQVTEQSRCLWFYPPIFDASVSDWGVALCSGATLVIEPNLTNASGNEIIETIDQRKITHADLPPSLVRLLPDRPSSLQTIIVGGQATDADTIERWARQVRLVNVYGPTEATVCTSIEVCTDRRDRPRLGQPIDNVEYRIVDTHLKTVAANKAGELLISGCCLAKGYRNQPELNRRKFVFIDGTRFYRTGDKVSRDLDGNYIFHGRIDRQISLNGQRIEPEEIESILTSIEGVTAAAVVMRKLSAESQNERLFAFIECGNPISTAQIRSRLAQTLPENKRPHFIHVLSKLPRTSSGKADLNQLASKQLKLGPIELTRPLGPSPVNDRLESIVEMFRQVTGEPLLNSEDAFLDWGGDSLAAIHLASLVEERGWNLPLWLIADNPTPREIAEFLNSTGPGIPQPQSDGPGGNSRYPYRCPVDMLRDDARSILNSVVNPIQSSPIAKNHPPDRNTIFVTGATGFLGCRVVAELLRHENTTIICLVRGRDGRHRLSELIQQQEVRVDESQFQRLQTIDGDVSKTNFGMASDDFEQLIRSVDCVVHCAANLNAMSNYSALRQTNVVGVANALSLAKAAEADFHFASTLSVFVGTDAHAGRHSENHELPAEFAFGGYAQTKLAAEYLLTECRQSIPIHIHRFGLLAADRRTGVFAESDILTMTIRALVRLGCVPKTDRILRFDMTPVDYAAQAMAAIILNAEANTAPRAWHIASRQTMTHEELISCLNRNNDANLQTVTHREFLSRLSTLPFNRDLACARMSFQRWRRYDDGDLFRPLDLFQSTMAEFDSKVTRSFVEPMGIKCPDITDDLIDSVLRRLCKTVTGRADD